MVLVAARLGQQGGEEQGARQKGWVRCARIATFGHLAVGTVRYYCHLDTVLYYCHLPLYFYSILHYYTLLLLPTTFDDLAVGARPVACAAHRQPGHEDICNRRCMHEACGRVASYAPLDGEFSKRLISL
jgi:hypothetical protein